MDGPVPGIPLEETIRLIISKDRRFPVYGAIAEAVHDLLRNKSNEDGLVRARHRQPFHDIRTREATNVISPEQARTAPARIIGDCCRFG